MVDLPECIPSNTHNFFFGVLSTPPPLPVWTRIGWRHCCNARCWGCIATTPVWPLKSLVTVASMRGVKVIGTCMGRSNIEFWSICRCNYVCHVCTYSCTYIHECVHTYMCCCSFTVWKMESCTTCQKGEESCWRGRVVYCMLC